jgi:hypothetical protein
METDAPFSYRETRDGTLFLSWNGRQVRVVKGRDAGALAARLRAADPRTAQMILAKATGNFKRGNERLGKEPPS